MKSLGWNTPMWLNITTRISEAPMTMKKGQDLTKQEIDSIEIAVEEASITAVHPDRMEAFADYLVRKLNEQEE